MCVSHRLMLMAHGIWLMVATGRVDYTTSKGAGCVSWTAPVKKSLRTAGRFP